MFKSVYKDNRKTGKGTVIFVDGSTYEGEFKDEEEHGYGVYKDNADGSVNKGSIKQFIINYSNIKVIT